MMLMLTPISEDEYNSGDPIFRVIVHDHPRKFGSFRCKSASHPLTLCWRSDLVQPLIVPDPQGEVVWIAIDQRVVCLAPQGNVLFSMGLSSPILQLLLFPSCAVGLCETQAFAINSDHSIRRIVDLREIPEMADLRDGKLVVTFSGGETESIPI
jgi:hypothetical protein